MKNLIIAIAAAATLSGCSQMQQASEGATAYFKQPSNSRQREMAMQERFNELNAERVEAAEAAHRERKARYPAPKNPHVIRFSCANPRTNAQYNACVLADVGIDNVDKDLLK